MRDIQSSKQYNSGSRIQNFSINKSENISPNNLGANSNYRDFEHENRKSRKFVVFGFIISLLVISVLVAVASFIFNGATVIIKPVKKDLPINETFVIEPEQRDAILVAKEIVVNESIALPKNSVKKVVRKAEGEILIYNNSDIKPQKLIKGTRFSTSDGKIYRLQDSVIVPGKGSQSDKEGVVRAKVTADTEGEVYNIGPARFTIPGFKGSSKFNTFYGESKVSMSGGSSGKSSNVSDLDMEKGKETLKTKVKEKLDNTFSNSAPDGFTFSKDTVYINYGSVREIDQDKTTSTYELSATGTALYIKRDVLVKNIVEKTENLNEANATVEIVNSNNFVISVSEGQNISDKTKPVRILITGSAPVIFKPNVNKIAEFLAGKNRSVFNEVTKKFQFVESANNVIRPFWSSSFPKDVSKISVEIEK